MLPIFHIYAVEGRYHRCEVFIYPVIFSLFKYYRRENSVFVDIDKFANVTTNIMSSIYKISYGVQHDLNQKIPQIFYNWNKGKNKTQFRTVS